MDNIIAQVEKQLEGLKTKTIKQNVGTVTEVGDGVCRIEGLSECQASELLDFGSGGVSVAAVSKSVANSSII